MKQVGVIGHGAIGSVVAGALRDGRVAGCELGGVLTRTARAGVPASVATLALATLGFDRTRVTIVGDRAAVRVRHVIDVEGDAGRYAFHIENTPSSNPRTSAITPFNVLRALCDQSDAVVVGL